MVNASVDFVLNDEETLNAEFEVTPDVTYEAVIDLSSATRKHNELSNRDLPDQHPISAITDLEETLYGYGHNIDDLLNTVAGYGDIVTHDTDEFATAEQGALADTALQPGDNISELVNDEGYLKAAALNGYATEGYVNAEIGNITDILDSYGNIVTHNVNEFATAEQGAKADTALQSGDNISELTNNVHYATESFVEDKIEDVTDTFGDIVTHNVSEFATSAQGALADTALQPNDDISELNNDVGYITSASLPTVNNGTLTIQKNGSDLGTFTANQATNTTVNVVVPTQASDINALPDTTTIADLTTTAQLNALNSGATTTNIGQITTNENDISDINDKIPSQASSSNQLADKSFVNSSIATNTANFIGTFNSVAELEAYSGTLTNNDYAFVQTTDTAGNTLYDRYKWNGSEWLFEYELNNSSFTASQWATINSGATSSDVALAQSALQPNDNVSELVNDAGYITSASLPTVNDATLTIQKNGTSVGTFTANASSNVTANITVPTDTTDLTNGAGFITGITSSDVTTALGYTPYNSTNPSGYISGITSGDVTTALGYTPADNSDVSAIQANYVTTNTNQTITADKTFRGNFVNSNNTERILVLKNTTADALTAPESTLYTGTISTRDKNDKHITNIRSALLTNGSQLSYNVRNYSEGNKHIQSLFRATTYSDGSGDMTFAVNNNGSGDARTATNKCLESSLSSTTETRLACQGWVNNPLTSTNVVHRSNYEAITGQKEFRGGIKINNTGSATYGILNQLSNGKIDWYCVGSDGNWSQNYIEMNPSYETVVRGATNVQLLGTTPATTNQSPTEDTTSSKQIDTVGARNTKINSIMNSILPTGSILPFGGSSAPTGFLMCDGSAVSRTTYSDLFDVIGTTYGSGDGSTTFNLPNLSSGVLPNSSTVSVVGNGNALGIVDDISTEAKQHNALVVGSGSSSFSSAKVPFAKFELSDPLAIGSQASSAQEFGTVRMALGVSTLPEWSGLTGSITGVSVNYIIKV